MKRQLLCTSLAIAGLAVSATASAVTADAFYAAPGLAMAIPDDDAVGVSSTISISDSFTIGKIAVVVVAEHTWVGDLIFTLTGPDGTTITLANQPGTTDPDADAGDNANLSTDHPIIFGDLSPMSAEMLGAGPCGNNTDAVIGLDCPRWVNPDESLGGTWIGTDAMGDWTLTVSDNTGLDIGTLDGWLIAFNYQAVPVPPAIWLFASGLFALVARRRRQ
jgi:subtilisin-like proprotein convertase family protein